MIAGPENSCAPDPTWKTASRASWAPGKLVSDAGGLPVASRTSAGWLLGMRTVAVTLGGSSAQYVNRLRSRFQPALIVPRMDR